MTYFSAIKAFLVFLVAHGHFTPDAVAVDFRAVEPRSEREYLLLDGGESLVFLLEVDESVLFVSLVLDLDLYDLALLLKDVHEVLLFGLETGQNR